MIGSFANVEATSILPPVLEVDLLGTRFRTWVDEPDLARHLAQLFAEVRSSPTRLDAETFEVKGGTPGSGWVLSRNGRGIFQTESRPRLLERYISLLNELALDNFPGLSVHAGVIAKDGCAIAIPGRSGVGKSTLVAACVAAGLDYVSDEALCIDLQTSQVVPYPRPLMLSDLSRQLVGPLDATSVTTSGKVAVTPADLRGRISTGPLNLTHVVLPHRGVAPSLERIPTSEIVPVLLERSFNRRPRSPMEFDLVASAVESCQAWRLGYTEAIDAAALIRRSLCFKPPAP